MNVDSIVSEVEKRLKAAGEASRRRVSTWYFPTKLKVFGVPVPRLRSVTRDVGRKLRDAPGPLVLRVAQALVRGGTFEGRQAAYEILGGHREAMAGLGIRDVERLAKGNDNWGSVDGFAVYVSGPAWRERRISDGTVKRWARSRDRWWRRAALVSTVPLNMRSRGGRGDTARTLSICKLLVLDRDSMVGKAMSWALRELAEQDGAAVVAFVGEHEADLPKRVVREVRTKLETGRKSPRKS